MCVQQGKTEKTIIDFMRRRKKQMKRRMEGEHKVFIPIVRGWSFFFFLLSVEHENLTAAGEEEKW